MSILNNLKDFFMPPDNEYDDPIETPVSRETEPRSTTTSSESAAPSMSSVNTESSSIGSGINGGSTNTSSASNFYREPEYEAPREERRSSKTVNIKTSSQLQVILVKPEVFADTKQIADHLMANKTVVLNLESASEANRRRIIDFLVGVAYAQNGNLKPVANQTYIITPYNVGFVGEELVGELENNGVIM